MLVDKIPLSQMFNGKNIDLKDSHFVRLYFKYDDNFIIIDIYPHYYNLYDKKLESIKINRNIQKIFMNKFELINKTITDKLGINSPSSDYHDCVDDGHKCRECFKDVSITYMRNDDKSNVLMIMCDSNISVQIIVKPENYSKIKVFIQALYSKL